MTPHMEDDNRRKGLFARFKSSEVKRRNEICPQHLVCYRAEFQKKSFLFGVPDHLFRNIQTYLIFLKGEI
ncbi:hypothetical protein TNCV_859641 [Trichonephila clavipes]|nr:hypothetical protein TNCV_859641 [Trichonephila clavipes]